MTFASTVRTVGTVSTPRPSVVPEPFVQPAVCGVQGCGNPAKPGDAICRVHIAELHRRKKRT